MDDRQKTDAERIAAEIERDELSRSVARFSDALENMRRRLSEMERRLADTESRTEDLEGDVESLEESPGSGGVEAEPQDEEEDDGGTTGSPPHAYQVETTADGKVLCFLPKMPDGTYFPVAMGGKHLGASTGTTADLDAGPYPAGGPASGSERPTWAHWGWYELEDALDTQSGDVNDKLVVATFSVPRDPPENERDDDTEVEGPKLTGVSLVDAADWRDHAEQTWKEFDPGGSEPLTREVVIAHIANGLVTQLTMTPFISLGNGTGDDWHPDSECGKFLSLDPMNEHACPDYETEEYQETENGVTVTKTRIVTDPQTGEPIQKTDGSGNPIYLAPKHQVHNFETGDDGGDTTYDSAYNRTEELVAVREPKEGGGAELFWRHIKFSQDAPCPPVIDVTEPVRSGNYVVFYVDVYEGAKVSGVCTSGQLIQHKEIGIPIINPELALQEKCVITGVQVGSGGITFQRESVLCVAGSGTCQPVTIEAEACEDA